MVNPPTSIRLNEENKAKLLALAKREGATISHVINKIIRGHSPTQTSEASNSQFEKRISELEKDLGTQRQRLVILKNQIDYLIQRTNDKSDFRRAK